MSLDAALSIASGSLANINRQLALVSQNVANAATPGYAREISTQQSLSAGGLGMGVRSGAAQRNVEIEYARNRERFAFLAWCQDAFRNFRVVPPDSGLVHQLNVKRLPSVVCTSETNGRDSHLSTGAKCTPAQRSFEGGTNTAVALPCPPAAACL